MRFHLIQSAANKADVSVDTVRSYCRQKLLSPERDSADRRLFTEGDIRRIREIYLENMTRRPSLRSHPMIHESEELPTGAKLSTVL